MVTRLVASWFGTGLILGRLRRSDAGSGTVASLVTLLPALALRPLGWGAQLAVAAVVAALAVWAVRPFSTDAGDPSWVVVDEAAGTFLATVGLGSAAALVAWVVFRVADIAKGVFPGVAAAERLPGAWGVTADDLVAALYGLAAGWLFQVLSQG